MAQKSSLRCSYEPMHRAKNSESSIHNYHNTDEGRFFSDFQDIPPSNSFTRRSKARSAVDQSNYCDFSSCSESSSIADTETVFEKRRSSRRNKTSQSAENHRRVPRISRTFIPEHRNPPEHPRTRLSYYTGHDQVHPVRNIPSQLRPTRVPARPPPAITPNNAVTCIDHMSFEPEIRYVRPRTPHQRGPPPLQKPISSKPISVDPLLLEELDQTSILSLATYRALRNILLPIQGWLGIKILADTPTYSPSTCMKVLYDDNIQQLTKPKTPRPRSQHQSASSSHEIKTKRHSHLELPSVTRTPISSSETVASSHNSEIQSVNTNSLKSDDNQDPRKEIDLHKMHTVVESVNCGSLEASFVTLSLSAYWVVPEFNFLRVMAKQNSLPNSSTHNSIESNTYGGQFSISGNDHASTNVRIGFKTRCYPHGEGTSTTGSKNDISIMLECDHAHIYDASTGDVKQIPEGMIGRSLISICLLDKYGDEIPDTMVQHTFGAVATTKIFSFPKYMTPRSDLDILNYQKLGSTGNSLVFKATYKALMTTSDQYYSQL